MSKHTPDKWVVIEVSNKQGESLVRVLAGWYGGYTGSDEWKLSSGVTDVKEYDDRYEFTNVSGSLYICYKNAFGMSGYMNTVYSKWMNQIRETGSNITLSILSKYATKQEA